MTSKRDLARYDRLVRYGCVCCKLLGFYSVPEIHHIVDKGYRKHSGGNKATLPLCAYHHRGVISAGFSLPAIRQLISESKGPSLADGSKPFHAHWGTQRELLDEVNKEISL